MPFAAPKSSRSSAIQIGRLGGFDRRGNGGAKSMRNSAPGTITPKKETNGTTPKKTPRHRSMGSRGWSHADFKLGSSIANELPKI